MTHTMPAADTLEENGKTDYHRDRLTRHTLQKWQLNDTQITVGSV
jgi:hypothetical protein